MATDPSYASGTGVYDLLCAEYCGLEHSGMIGLVRVVPEGEYAEWLDQNKPSEGGAASQQGFKLYQSKGCVGCHSTDGSRMVGPSFLGVYGHQVSLRDGSTATADENYIRESILNPSAKVAAGYQPIMPTFQGLITEEGVLQLVEYIKSLTPAPRPGVGPGTTPASKPQNR